MTEIIGVRFKSGGKQYYFDPVGLPVESGQGVIIETSRGIEYGECVKANTMVEDETVVQPLRPVIRLATQADEDIVARNREKEERAFRVCQEKIAQHGLDMKLVEVEYSFDGNKILFFFTSEGRVDFRALVKDLAGVFHTRIELRQIGVRDEARMLGGLGICGKPFCCATFLNEFQPVSIKMAKTQNLSLNPTKISGTCGRLMCCLKYEQDAYEDAVRRMPKQESLVETPEGVGTVSQVDLLRERVKVRLDDAPEAPQCFCNCEVCVVRNGKGKRPEGYVPPSPQELAKLRCLPKAEEEGPASNASERSALSQALEKVFQGSEESAPPKREKKNASVHKENKSGRRPFRKNPEATEQDQKATEPKKPRTPKSHEKSAGEHQPKGEWPHSENGQKNAKGEEVSGEKKKSRSRRRHRSGGGTQTKPPAGES